MNAALGERLRDAPRLAAPATARKRLESLLRDPRAEALAPLAESKATRALLLGIADHSPFLWSLIAEDPGRLARLLAAPPEDALGGADRSRSRRAAATTRTKLKRALRRAKREAALLIALADIGGVWDVVATTEALTRFADAAVGAAVALPAAARGARGTARARRRRRRHRGRLRLRRARARQARRARAQLFERHRPDRASTTRDRRRFPPTPSRRRCSCAWSRRWPGCCRSARPTAMSSASICACRPDPRGDAGGAVDRQRRSPITRRSARTGSARR